VIVKLGIMEKITAFDWIPKLHMMGHYTHSICEFGTPDSYNLETPECLHIEYAKKGWQVPNQCNPIPQIIKFVQHREAIKIHQTYLNELYGEKVGEQDWGYSVNMGSGGDDKDADS
jgi:hypothetical protein